MPVDELSGQVRLPRTQVSAAGATRPSALARRIADGSYTADAHALARSILEYVEDLAGEV